MRIFLLTKTPNSERTRLCMRLVAGSQDAVVYLAGDGVYNLMGQGEAGHASQASQALASTLPRHRILACREDLEARGVSAEGKATVPADFYERLVDDMMREGSQVYSF
ncbi:MAG: DsrH/TusB family sulfur relay protein [Methanothrix sp.]